jgi:hypothetical protein
MGELKTTDPIIAQKNVSARAKLTNKATGSGAEGNQAGK